MKTFIILLIVIILALIIKYLIETKISSKKDKNYYKEIHNNKKQGYYFYGNFRKELLTPHEKVFFNQLIELADRYHFYIFPKVGFIDIFETDNDSDKKKLNTKHIDFTICTKESHPVLFIELDDSSHESQSAKERDRKKEIISLIVQEEIYLELNLEIVLKH